MGQIAECEVLARRIVVPPEKAGGRQSYAYSDCSVIGAPVSLPDGEYLVRFHDCTFQITRQRGLWLSPGHASRNPESPAFE